MILPPPSRRVWYLVAYTEKKTGRMVDAGVFSERSPSLSPEMPAHYGVTELATVALARAPERWEGDYEGAARALKAWAQSNALGPLVLARIAAAMLRHRVMMRASCVGATAAPPAPKTIGLDGYPRAADRAPAPVIALRPTKKTPKG